MTRTRRWLGGLLGAALLTAAFPIAAQAQSADPSVDSVDSETRLEAAKNRITAEIEKRLSAIERLSERTESAKHLTAQHATALLIQFTAADAALQEGISDIASAATPAELRDIATPLFEGTLVFALLVPKTKAVIAADSIGAVTDRHEKNAARVQSELDRLSAAGIDTENAQTNLDDASRIVTEVAAAAAPIADSVISLQPGDEIKAPLAEARAALRGTRGELHEARRLTQQVGAFIRRHAADSSPES